MNELCVSKSAPQSCTANRVGREASHPPRRKVRFKAASDAEPLWNR